MSKTEKTLQTLVYAGILSILILGLVALTGCGGIRIPDLPAGYSLPDAAGACPPGSEKVTIQANGQPFDYCRPTAPAPTDPEPTPDPEPPPPVEPDPTPVCKVGETCGCWHRPPGQPWTQLPACPPPAKPDPTPDPPAPGACPPLARVDAYLLANIGPGGVILPKTQPLQRGGRAVLDSTPKFAFPTGVSACNADRPEACGCPIGNPTCCEDVRGHVWTQLQGDCPWSYNDPTGDNPTSGFSIKVGPFTGACRAEFQACARGDFPGPVKGVCGRTVWVEVK